jgi:CelD/BcsL family acetyltransferase involved in cellulose biosynthesis
MTRRFIGTTDVTLDAARADWQRLAEASGNFFSTWEWADAWMRHLGEGCELRLHAVAREGEVVAILPLVLSRIGPLRLLRFVGHGPADELGPVCDPADRQAAAQAVEELEGFHVFVGERVRPGMGLGRMLRTEPSPVLPVRGRSFDEYLAGRSRNFREQVRRRRRKLAREHDLSFRLSDAERLQDDLTTLFRLHASRWQDPGAFGGPLEAFHRDFAARALERGWLRLWTMEIDGRPAAAWYGIRFAGVESYYQAGRDPDLDRVSAGFVLLAHTIEAAFDDGVSEYRFLLGDEPFKGRFAEEDERVETFTVTRSLRGRAAVAAAQVALRMPPAIRRRVRGLT